MAGFSFQNELSVGFLKSLHECNELLDAFHRHCIVDGSAHTADTAVTFQVDETGLAGFLDEQRIQFLVAGDEADIHHGAVLGILNGGVEQLGIVQIIIEHIGFLLVALFHLFQTADVVFQPFQHQLADVDGIGGRGVVHGAVVGVGLIIEHGGADGCGVTDQVFPDDDDGEACGSHILLCAGVDHTVFADVHRLTEDAGGEVRNDGNIAGIGQLMEAGAVDGIVVAQVEVVRIRGKLLGIQFGDVGEGLILAGSDSFALSELLGFLIRLGTPLAGDDEVGL